ncbi:hypothetical protein RSK20926_15501 [Roseobacter sp. SK209-2-6]|nr:hypothetical protein RSK20926_15501 [Roseobacter sp. SK209-2-6]
MAHCSISGGKILNCCYCGVQATFVPSGLSAGAGVTSLVCSACGAPLAAQKARPLAPGKGASLPEGAKIGASSVREGKAKKVKSKGKIKKTKAQKGSYAKVSVQKPRKKKKSLFQKVFSEAVDLVEDIFD